MALLLSYVQAMHAGPWGDAGHLFPIYVDDGEHPSSIKRKLAGPTGIPVEAQKIMLGAFSQLAVADKRTNIKFGSCGVTDGLGLTVEVRAVPRGGAVRTRATATLTATPRPCPPSVGGGRHQAARPARHRQQGGQPWQLGPW